MRADHIVDPQNEGRTLCDLTIKVGQSYTDVRNGVAKCRTCTREADAFWAAEEATWD